MDELERWLTLLGLAQLAPVLRANDVDLEILPELNEADLEKLGLSLGQRKKLMKAVASLPLSSSSVAPNAAPAPSLNVPSSAERRQLTVMFCDLVGSTALASRLDPEDLREVIGGYHRCVAATVARFDGFVAKYMGDGVLLYFGYPQAHEDDAERAVRAGLALVDAVGRLQASRTATSSHRHRHRSGSRGRCHRHRGRTRASGRRRDAKFGGATADRGRS